MAEPSVAFLQTAARGNAAATSFRGRLRRPVAMALGGAVLALLLFVPFVGGQAQAGLAVRRLLAVTLAASFTLPVVCLGLRTTDVWRELLLRVLLFVGGWSAVTFLPALPLAGWRVAAAELLSGAYVALLCLALAGWLQLWRGRPWSRLTAALALVAVWGGPFYTASLVHHLPVGRQTLITLIAGGTPLSVVPDLWRSVGASAPYSVVTSEHIYDIWIGPNYPVLPPWWGWVLLCWGLVAAGLWTAAWWRHKSAPTCVAPGTS
jgi:hypothetical protein